MHKIVDREPIWVALFSLLKTQLGPLFQTMGRHHLMPPALALEQQPALFVVQARETRSPRPSGLPGKIMLSGFIILYFPAPLALEEAAGAETVLGATTLNALLGAIDTALLPDSQTTGTLTLGGLVQHCWLEGEVDVDTGVYTQQGAAILPLRILLP